MKRLIAAAAVAALLALPAAAEDIAEHCETYVAQNGGDASGCSCLGDAAAGDTDLTESLLAILTPADLEAADEPTKAAIAACFPDAAT